MDKQTILAFALSAVQGLWGVFGATAMVSVTAFFNTVVKSYIPREIQIPLAGVLSAVLASLAGADPGTAIVEGSAIQAALSMNPNTFLSGSKTGK
jgi:hypothetical protein